MCWRKVSNCLASGSKSVLCCPTTIFSEGQGQGKEIGVRNESPFYQHSSIWLSQIMSWSLNSSCTVLLPNPYLLTLHSLACETYHLNFWFAANSHTMLHSHIWLTHSASQCQPLQATTKFCDLNTHTLGEIKKQTNHSIQKRLDLCQQEIWVPFKNSFPIVL